MRQKRIEIAQELYYVDEYENLTLILKTARLSNRDRLNILSKQVFKDFHTLLVDGLVEL